jgi:ABC-type hemin transport system ATPase subunit
MHMKGIDPRYDATMRQCRVLERHAASLRGELLWLAGGEGNRVRVARALDAMREQLRRAELLADGFVARDAA